MGIFLFDNAGFLFGSPWWHSFSRNYFKSDFYKLNYIYKDSETLSLSTTIAIPFSFSLTHETTKVNLHSVLPHVRNIYFTTQWQHFKPGLPNWTKQYMYFNHLRLISTTTTVGDRHPRNSCQELNITALPGNQFTVPPRKTKQKTSIAQQEYPQFETIHPPPLPRSQHPTFCTAHTFYIIITF